MLDRDVPMKVWTAVGSLIAALRETLSKNDPDTIHAEIIRLLGNETIWANSGIGFPTPLQFDRDMRELREAGMYALSVAAADPAKKARLEAILKSWGEELDELRKEAA